MAINNLTPEQDLATREFFRVVVKDNTYLALSPASRKSLIGSLLTALNYNWLPNGSFVSKGTVISMPYGSTDYSKYPDEWVADEERARENIDTKDTIEASASSESSDTEVREAVLPEDVL